MMSILCCCTALAASVICTRPSHVYTSREAAEFEVSADKPGSPIEVAFSRAYLAPFETFVTTTPVRVSCTLKEPGFIVCTVRERLADGTFGKPVRAGAGFDPTKIRTVLPPPKDYDAFWKSAFAEQDAIPADFTSKPLSNGVELVSCRTVWGTRMYGFLRIPKGTGPFPVQVMVWGGSSIVPLDEAVAAGASPEYAKRGFLFIHLPAWEPVARTSKEANARQAEWMRSVGSERAGLHYWNCEKGPRERWFYRCILGSCRLIDYVAGRPGVDRARIYYRGASTGGGYGVFLAAFSPHIRAAICEVPNYGNIAGPSVGRPCGEDDRGEHWQTSLYYDTAYCAPRITCPVFMSAGYVDNSCCPETVYAIYNALTCPKTMYDKVENGHGDVPKGYREKRQAWLDGVLSVPTRAELLRTTFDSDDTNYVFVVAHRADWRHHPENSIAAIRGAIEMGADMVEIDVAKTKDGVHVLSHDGRLDRVSDKTGAICDLTLAEVKSARLRMGQGGAQAALTEERVPTLAEALEACRGRILVNIDKFNKDPNGITAVIQRLGVARQVVLKGRGDYATMRARTGEPWQYVESRDFVYMPIADSGRTPDGLEAVRKSFADWDAAPYAPPAYEVCVPGDAPLALVDDFRASPRHPRLWINTLWDALAHGHSESLKGADFTPDGVWGHWIRLGATMIQTDDPAALVTYLENLGRRTLPR